MNNQRSSNKAKKQDEELERRNNELESKTKKALKKKEFLSKDYVWNDNESKSLSESQKDEDMLVDINENYIKKANELFAGTNFSFSLEDGLKYIDTDHSIDTEISNTLTIPVKHWIYKTIDRTKSEIEIKGIVAPSGEELPNIKVPVRQIDSGNWIINDEWGLKVKLQGKKKLQVDSLKELDKGMKVEIIYNFTGFTTINGKKVFLTSNGAIGTDETVKVDLVDENLKRYELTEGDYDIKDTIHITFACLNVAPKRITVVIVALIFMSIFTSTFAELGISVGFVTWVMGQQACKKTSMVTAICSHFRLF